MNQRKIDKLWEELDYYHKCFHHYIKYHPYKRKKQGCVYFIQQGYRGPFKIGISNRPLSRLSSIQTCNPEKLRLLYYDNFPLEQDIFNWTIKEVEKNWHIRLKEFSINGEWFYPTLTVLKEILQYIRDDIPFFNNSCGGWGRNEYFNKLSLGKIDI